MWVNCEMSDVIQSGAPKHNAILPESHINSPCNIGVNKKKIRKAYMSVKWILVKYIWHACTVDHNATIERNPVQLQILTWEDVFDIVSWKVSWRRISVM